MKDLENLRNRIDAIDQDIVELYNERMRIVSDVAELKRGEGGSIYRPEREESIMRKVTDLAGEANAHKIGMLYKTIMRQSRERQYEIISADMPVERIIGCGTSSGADVGTVAYAGLPGSYTHIAAGYMYPAADMRGLLHFDSVMEAVADGACDAGILPIYNTTEGIVADVYEGLMKRELYISDSIALPISHCLLGVRGAALNDIVCVISHPQALGQCADYLRGHGFTPLTDVNTSVAAQKIAREGNRSNAAIASAMSAELYGLDVLADNISDSDCNKTRFIAVTKTPVITPQANRISLCFTLPHESGSLSNILSVAADYRLNLVNLQSLPLPQKPWEYRFYMDITGNVDDPAVRAILYMLFNELEEIRFLGNYNDTDS